MKYSSPVLMLVLAGALTACGKDTPPAESTSAPAGTAAAPAETPAAPPAAPAAPAAAPTTAAAPTAPAPAAAAPADTAVAAAPAGVDGNKIYNNTCALCHAAGVAGAPMPGNKDDWGPRIAQGKDTLYKHALEGFTGQKGMMPPRGGNPNLKDEEVKAAVDFMVQKSS